MLRSQVLARSLFSHCALLVGLAAGCLAGASSSSALDFDRIVVFGDSLSDVGNDGKLSRDKYKVTFPGTNFNYTDGRFTSGKDTDPASKSYGGIWHEQLAKLYLGQDAVVNSLDNGFDYAYGGATTEDGATTLKETLGGIDVSLDVPNMGKQVNDYLARETPNATTLYILWGGANDLFNTPSNDVALAAADRESALVQKLAEAGARRFLVPNLPPLGATPEFNRDATQAAALTTYAANFRDQLNADLDTVTNNLSAQGIGVEIFRLDVYNLFGRLLKNPAAYGFANITNSAQGESAKADQYLFWDGVHPTAAGHYQLAAEALTLLTGTPVMQIFPKPTQDGFYLTRSGVNIDSLVKVPFTLGGKAQSGRDYVTFKKDLRKLKPGKQTAQIKVQVTEEGAQAPAKQLKLTLTPNEAVEYVLSPANFAKIRVGPLSGVIVEGVDKADKIIDLSDFVMLPGTGSELPDGDSGVVGGDAATGNGD